MHYLVLSLNTIYPQTFPFFMIQFQIAITFDEGKNVEIRMLLNRLLLCLIVGVKWFDDMFMTTLVYKLFQEITICF
jgi:hypothetical protein